MIEYVNWLDYVYKYLRIVHIVYYCVNHYMGKSIDIYGKSKPIAGMGAPYIPPQISFAGRARLVHFPTR